MHLVVYFFSTSEGKESSDNPFFSLGRPKDYIYLFKNEKIATVMVNGCWHKDVCNGEIFPDLRDYAQRFVSTMFSTDHHNTLILNNTIFTKGHNTIGVQTEFCSPTATTRPQITEITFCGYSRGAVTCFEAAREINKIAPSIPVNIVANQPVPGNVFATYGTNAGRISDCSDITNLKKVSIILGSSTTTERWHRLFYNQIIPKLPRNSALQREIIVIPKWEHHGGPSDCQMHNMPFGEKHLHMQVTKYLFESRAVSMDLVKEKSRRAKNSYNKGDRIVLEKTPTQQFPLFDNLQAFFGINSRQLYRYKDRLHPSAHLFEGYEWNTEESLINWWNRHDQKNSCFKSVSTTTLIKGMKGTNTINVQTLLMLFERVEEWLIEKEFSNSSRYWMVTALKNNIFHKLTHDFDIKPAYLETLSQKIKHKNQYYQKYWNTFSTAASFFKTQVTEVLDQKFEDHALGKINDQALILALCAWIKQKEGSNTKRWEIVLEMKEMLEESLKNAMPSENINREDGRNQNPYLNMLN